MCFESSCEDAAIPQSKIGTSKNLAIHQYHIPGGINIHRYLCHGPGTVGILASIVVKTPSGGTRFETGSYNQDDDWC